MPIHDVTDHGAAGIPGKPSSKKLQGYFLEILQFQSFTTFEGHRELIDTWYSQEGGKSARIVVKVCLKDSTGRIVTNEIVPLKLQLFLENGTEINDENQFAVDDKKDLYIDESGEAVIKYRINTLSSKINTNLKAVTGSNTLNSSEEKKFFVRFIAESDKFDIRPVNTKQILVKSKWRPTVAEKKEMEKHGGGNSGKRKFGPGRPAKRKTPDEDEDEDDDEGDDDDDDDDNVSIATKNSQIDASNASNALYALPTNGRKSERLKHVPTSSASLSSSGTGVVVAGGGGGAAGSRKKQKSSSPPPDPTVYDAAAIPSLSIEANQLLSTSLTISSDMPPYFDAMNKLRNWIDMVRDGLEAMKWRRNGTTGRANPNLPACPVQSIPDPTLIIEAIQRDFDDSVAASLVALERLLHSYASNSIFLRSNTAIDPEFHEGASAVSYSSGTRLDMTRQNSFNNDILLSEEPGLLRGDSMVSLMPLLFSRSNSLRQSSSLTDDNADNAVSSDGFDQQPATQFDAPRNSTA